MHPNISRNFQICISVPLMTPVQPVYYCCTTKWPSVTAWNRSLTWKVLIFLCLDITEGFCVDFITWYIKGTYAFFKGIIAYSLSIPPTITKIVFDILGNRHRYLDFNCRTELTTANIKIFFPCQYLLIPSTDTKKVIKWFCGNWSWFKHKILTIMCFLLSFTYWKTYNAF